MSLKDLLIHNCSVIYLQKKDSIEKYGLPPEDEYFYPETPSKIDVASYFYRAGAIRIDQQEPFEVITERLSVMFLPNEDIRHNDRVVFNDDTFKIENPIIVKGHHIEASAVRVNQ